MKKVSVIAIYGRVENNVRLYNLTVHYKGSITPFVRHAVDSIIQSEYECFSSMYTDILRLIKINGFYVDSYKAFGSVCYDVMWNDIESPQYVNKFYLNENE